MSRERADVIQGSPVLRRLDAPAFDARAAQAGVRLPIEQASVWDRVEAALPGHEPWGHYAVEGSSGTLALVSLARYHAHGYRYAWAKHGPVWVGSPTPRAEAAVALALRREVARRDRLAVFARLHIASQPAFCHPILSTVTYDRTVVIDVRGDGEAILARMKPRGRRDVRKSIRESGLACADETERASGSFSEYYPVMVETARRDGFVPWDSHTYADMIRALGPTHCRVYAGRIGGRVVNWSIVTIEGDRATRYYAASSTATMRARVSDRLVFFECEQLSRRGITGYDLMGIGSDIAPSLRGLNEFKTKFSKVQAEVAPARDVPVRPLAYAALVRGRALVVRLRSRRG